MHFDDKSFEEFWKTGPKVSCHAMIAWLTDNNEVTSFLEIGVQEGKSLRHALKSRPLQLYLCDTWGKEYGGTGRGSHEHILKLIHEKEEQYGVKHEVYYLDGSSHDLIKKLPDGLNLDMVHIDGDHSYDGCMMDMVDSIRLLKIGGLMLIHDVAHHVHPYLEQCVHDFSDSRQDAELIYVNRQNLGIAVIKKQAAS